MAVLAREHLLRPREDRLAAVQARERPLVAGARRPHELLGLLAQLSEVEVHRIRPPSSPCPQGG